MAFFLSNDNINFCCHAMGEHVAVRGAMTGLNNVLRMSVTSLVYQAQPHRGDGALPPEFSSMLRIRTIYFNIILPYIITFEEEQIIVIQPSDDSCGSFLGGTKAGNERNDAIRHKNLCLVIELLNTQMLVRSRKPFLTLSFT